MRPFGDVDVVPDGFASAVATQLSVGDHLAQVACGGGFGNPGHLDVFLGVQPPEKAAIAIVEQALQNSALAFVQCAARVRFPGAPFEEGTFDS
ncbi:MAG: hypothetical protein R3E99_05730 [Burkholderiaceae bacterium]